MLVKHVGQTVSNIVEHNMLDPFEQHNQTCWIVLDGVGRCWMKFDFVQISKIKQFFAVPVMFFES